MTGLAGRNDHDEQSAARSRDYVVLTVGNYVACIVAAFIGGVLVSLLTFGPLS